MKNETYDKWKEFAQVWLPALGTLYFALDNIWGLPYGTEIVGTLTAVDACIGTILHISTKNYDGDAGNAGNVGNKENKENAGNAGNGGNAGDAGNAGNAGNVGNIGNHDENIGNTDDNPE